MGIGMESDVDKLRGIGPKYTQLLEKIGVDSIDELRNRDAASLVAMIETRHGKVVGLSLSRVQGWIDQAQMLGLDAPPDPLRSGEPRSLPETNESLVRAMFDAWAACDEEVLDRLVATDVVFRIAGEEPYVGREAVFARWDRQDELLQDVA